MQGDEVTFNVFSALKCPTENDSCFYLESIEDLCSEISLLRDDPLEVALNGADDSEDSKMVKEIVTWMNSFAPNRRTYFEDLGVGTSRILPSIEQAPELKLKTLPSHLKYSYLGNSQTLPVIISADLTPEEEAKLIRVIRDH